nr:glycosyltransferase [Sulfitobacter pontiacus]
MKTISCVIPCFNCEDTLDRAVQSILAQTSEVDEIVLVDDRSTDATWLAITSLAERHGRIIPVRLDQNSGPSVARNAGWEIATSDWIAFLDADDTWHPQKIDLVRKAAALVPSAGLFGHLVDVRNPKTLIMEETFSSGDLQSTLAEISPLKFKLFNQFSTPTVVLRRDTPFRFDETMRFAEDYLLWSTLVLSGVVCVKLELPLGSLYKARYGEGGLSGQTSDMRVGEIKALQKLKDMGLLTSAEHFALNLFWFLKYLRRVFL